MSLFARHHRAVRLVLLAVGLLAILAAWLLRGEGSGDSIASIVSAFVGLLTFAGALSGPEPPVRDPEEVARHIRTDVKIRWCEEAQNRNLLAAPLYPVSLSDAGGPVPGPDVDALSPEDFQTLWAGFATGAWRRLVVSGEAGSGKTTLALMMTLGMTDGPVPLLVPLGSWDPAKTGFDRWINDELPRLNPSIDTVARRGRAAELLGSGDYLLILDGFDELPRGTSKDAVDQIGRFVPSTAPLVVFTRPSHARSLARLPRMRHVTIDPVSGTRAAAYLQALTPGRLPQGLLDDLCGDASTGLARALSTPRNLRSAWLGLADGSVDLAELRAIGGNGDTGIMSRYLVRRHMATIFSPRSRFGMLRRRGARRWVTFIASRAKAAGGTSMAWWRLVDTVPAPVLPLLSAMSVAPAYVMSLAMPVGLTRGFAIGCAVAIGASLIGGRRVSGGTIAAVFCVVAGLVLPVGTTRLGWEQGLCDAVEIAVAVTLAYRNMPRLFAPGDGPARPWRRRRTAATTVVGIAATAAIATEAASALVGHHDPDRGPVGLFLGVLFGLGVAVGAARLYLVSGNTTRPSTVRLRPWRRRGGLLAPMLLSIAAASSIGLAGAVGGGLRFGLGYGLNVLVFYGCVIGLPVGLTAGIIKWLAAQPRDDAPRAAAGNSYLREGTVALSAAASVTLASVGGLLLLDGPLSWIADLLARHSPGLQVHPADGILVGLTVGMVVASAETAWPAFFIAHCWHALHGSLPWRMHRFVRDLHRAEIFRREGEIYRFREDVLVGYFATDQPLPHQPIRPPSPVSSRR
jgi:hypothetical protein